MNNNQIIQYNINPRFLAKRKYNVFDYIWLFRLLAAFNFRTSNVFNIFLCEQKH